MAIAEPTNVIEYVDGEDPREKVLSIIMPIIEREEIYPYLNEVLIVTAPNKARSRGGIIMPEVRKKEQRWQCKVGLVVAIGEVAFNDDKLWPNVGTRPQIGDWVMFMTPDTRECDVGGHSLRFVDDDKIRGKCRAPDSVR
jgi:co-chaperonin GroES (HSP10)